MSRDLRSRVSRLESHAVLVSDVAVYHVCYGEDEYRAWREEHARQHAGRRTWGWVVVAPESGPRPPKPSRAGRAQDHPSEPCRQMSAS